MPLLAWIEVRHLAAVEHQRVQAALALELDGIDTRRHVRVLRVEEEVPALDVDRLLRRALRLLVARTAAASPAAARRDHHGRRIAIVNIRAL